MCSHLKALQVVLKIHSIANYEAQTFLISLSLVCSLEGLTVRQKDKCEWDKKRVGLTRNSGSESDRAREPESSQS